MNFSVEQETAIMLSERNNMIINSVAGSGKTTVLLHICKKYPSQSNLLLTYNKDLQTETVEKAKKMKLTNVTPLTLHSCCSQFYGIKCQTDEGIKEVLDKDLKPQQILSFDRIIGDEFQDQTPIYFRLFCKIIRDFNCAPLITIVGDVKQCIYQYNGSDERFLSFGSRLLRSLNEFEWKEVKLTQSFRISTEIAHFTCSLYNNTPNFITSKKALYRKPVYCIMDQYEPWKIADILKRNNVNFQLKANDTFVLAKSIRDSKLKQEKSKSFSPFSPICKFENYVKSNVSNFLINVSVDDEKIRISPSGTKMEISSYHRTKGLEARQIFVFNFDSSYFEYFARDQNPSKCPNDIYVAVTRAKDHLVLLHHFDKDMLGFLDPETLLQDCDVTFVQDVYEMLLRRFNGCFNRFRYNLKFDKNYDDNGTPILKRPFKKDKDYSIKLQTYQQKLDTFKQIVDNFISEETRKNQEDVLKYGGLEKYKLLLILRRFQENKDLTLFNLFGRQFEKFQKNEPVNKKQFVKTKKQCFEDFKTEFDTFGLRMQTFYSDNQQVNKEDRKSYSHEHNMKRLKYKNIFLLSNFTVTDFLRNLNVDFKEDILPKLASYTVKQPKENEILIPCEVTGEQVSDINGIVIPTIYQHVCCKDKNAISIIFDKETQTDILSLIEKCKKTNGECIQNANTLMEQIMEKIKDKDATTNPEFTIEEYTFMATCYWTYQNNYFFKICQLKTYQWISEKQKTECVNRIINLKLSTQLEFEKKVSVWFPNEREGTDYGLSGRIDCFDTETNIVWEFKCVKELQHIHKIQLLLYMFLLGKETGKTQTDIMVGHLFNIRTNELIEIKCNFYNLEQIVVHLCNCKLNSNPTEFNDDEEFLECFKA